MSLSDWRSVRSEERAGLGPPREADVELWGWQTERSGDPHSSDVHLRVICCFLIIWHFNNKCVSKTESLFELQFLLK